jgi:uncharacterized membrane protein YeaQ/YmgE (transglycosylase-associated protein family)
MGIIIALIVGGLAGYVASLIAARDSSLGIIGNIVVGFLGAGLANFLFAGDVALSQPTLGSFLLAVAGAVILLVVVNLFTRKSVR